MYITKGRYQYYKMQLKEKEQRLDDLIKAKNEALENVNGIEEVPYASMSWNKDIRIIKNEMESIREILENATIVERGNEVDDVVDLGDRFTIEFEDGKRESFKLVSTFMEPGEVSLSSPMGKDIYRKRLGDSGEYQVNKKTFRYTIVGLENAQDTKALEKARDSEPQL